MTRFPNVRQLPSRLAPVALALALQVVLWGIALVVNGLFRNMPPIFVRWCGFVLLLPATAVVLIAPTFSRLESWFGLACLFGFNVATYAGLIVTWRWRWAPSVTSLSTGGRIGSGISTAVAAALALGAVYLAISSPRASQVAPPLAAALHRPDCVPPRSWPSLDSLRALWPDSRIARMGHGHTFLFVGRTWSAKADLQYAYYHASARRCTPVVIITRTDGPGFREYMHLDWAGPWSGGAQAGSYELLGRTAPRP